MNVLLLGGGGYLGTRLAEFLCGLDVNVSVFDLFWFGNHITNPEVYVETKNIIDISEEEYQGYDVVVYLAGLSNDPMAEFSPSLNYIHNASYPVICAHKAKAADVKKFIFASSCSIYGVGRMCKEHDSPSTNYPYGISKWQAESGLKLLQDNDFQVVCLRKGTLGGDSPRMRFDLCVNKMYKDATLNKKITVYDPDAQRPILDIRDAITAYTSVIFSNKYMEDTYNIISENVSILEIATRIKHHFIEDVSIEIEGKSEVRDYSADWSSANNDFGFMGSYMLEDTIDELVGYEYDFADDQTINIKVFKKLEGKL